MTSLLGVSRTTGAGLPAEHLGLLLERSVAIPLVHALVADVAETIGVRYLTVKGVGSQLSGLRSARVPSDVDVLLTPSDEGRFRAELRARGWIERPADPDTVIFPRHSTSLFHWSWPCDIDVHFRFPGLEHEPGKVFDVLWRDREHYRQCQSELPQPGREAGLVILALHCLRSSWVQRHRDEYDELIGIAKTMKRDAVVAQAQELGALACTRPFLEAAFGSGLEVEWGEPSEEWRFRTTVASPHARRILVLRTGTWKQRRRIIRLALIPPRDAIAKNDIHQDLRGPRIVRAYLRRWVGGIRSLPLALRELADTSSR
jgi:hypothetical protein